VLAVEKNRAESTAGKMEHTIDKEVLERFVCFLAFISRDRRKGKTWREEFARFIKKGIGSQSCQQCIDEYLNELERDRT